jgi:SH3-like domain-containing protein
MKYAFVTTNLLDLKSGPDFDSERTSQLLFAEPVTVLKEAKEFWQVSQADGYTGWTDKRFLKTISKNNFEYYLNKINAVVALDRARIVTSDGNKTTEPYFLYYGTGIWVSHINKGFCRTVLPDKTVVFLKSRAVRPINKKMSKNISGKRLVNEALKFLGVPYLWGGVSPAGFDCSGLVRAVCSRYGLYVPRDTAEQIKTGIKISRDEVKTGDLIFFKRHVGFAIGKEKIIHSSMGGGGVRINSLNPEHPHYRADLDRDYNQARRIL